MGIFKLIKLEQQTRRCCLQTWLDLGVQMMLKIHQALFLCTTFIFYWLPSWSDSFQNKTFTHSCNFWITFNPSPVGRCFWTVEKILRVPWTARRSNLSILKEVNSKYSLEGLMLKLQYFGHLMLRANSLEKTLILGKIQGRRRGQQRTNGWMASLTQRTWVWASSGRWWRTGKPGML